MKGIPMFVIKLLRHFLDTYSEHPSVFCAVDAARYGREHGLSVLDSLTLFLYLTRLRFVFSSKIPPAAL